MSNIKELKLRVENEDLIILQRKDMFCISLDTLLLANFVTVKNRDKIIVDFGTNNGIIAIWLALKYNIKTIGIEIQEEAVKLAIKNVELNKLVDRVKIFNDDIKTYAQRETNTKVDMVVCNPPFFPLLDKSKLKQEPFKAIAHHELNIDLLGIIKSASLILKPKGKLFMIYPTARIDELFILMKQYQFAIKKMQIIYPKASKNANVFLIEAVYQTSEGIIMLPPLICHNEDNTYNSEVAKWYNFKS